jgi:hypothetical protein
MTILITKSSLNIIALTLSELEDETLDVNWLFRFTKDEGRQEIFCYLNDLNESQHDIICLIYWRELMQRLQN